MSETAGKSAPYVPHAAAASERMVGSVMNRLGGGRAWQLAGRVVDGFLNEQGSQKSGRPAQRAPERVVAAPPSFPQPTAKPEGMWDAALASPSQHRQGGASESRQAPPMTTLQAFEPSDVVRGGLQAREAANSTSPLWSVLPPAKLEPLVSALERSVAKPQERELPRAPGMTLLQGGGGGEAARAGSSPTGRQQLYQQQNGQNGDDRRGISKAAIDASAKLLDALRAHASAHAAAGDSRVTLGQMTLIAHADKNKQLAASMGESVPQPKEPDKALGDIPNPKVFSNQHSILLKIREIANKLIKEDNDDKNNGDSRFGDA